MRQLNEKSRANNISHILLYTEVKVDYAMLEIPTVHTWNSTPSNLRVLPNSVCVRVD
jgi:hypothetical protein